MITPEELDYIRTAAIGDMLGDPGALDEMGSAATIFRLCRELERMDREADWLIRERIVAEWKILPKAINLIANGKVSVDDHIVTISD